MRDEIFDRDYQAGRDALNGWISRLVEDAAQSFRVLNAIQFAAPWRQDARAPRGRATKHA